jgi:hypothetical protein
MVGIDRQKYEHGQQVVRLGQDGRLHTCGRIHDVGNGQAHLVAAHLPGHLDSRHDKSNGQTNAKPQEDFTENAHEQKQPSVHFGPRR